MSRAAWPLALVGLVAVLAVTVVGTGHAQDNAEATVEVRVWQSLEDAERLYISARPEFGSWATLGTIPLPLDDGRSRDGRYLYGDISLDVPLADRPAVPLADQPPVTVEVRVWQHFRDFERIYISARPASGSWATLGTISLPLDGETSSGRFRYGDITLNVPLRQERPAVATPETGGKSIRFELTPSETGWAMHVESDHDIPSFGIELRLSLLNRAAIGLPSEDIKAGVRHEVERSIDEYFLSSEVIGSIKTFHAGTLTNWTCERQEESWRFHCAEQDSRRLPPLTDADDPRLWVYMESREGSLTVRVTAGDENIYFPYLQARYRSEFAGLDIAEFCGDFSDPLWARGSQELMECPLRTGWDELVGRLQHTDVSSLSVLSTNLHLLRCDRHEASTSEMSVWACDPW